MRTLVLGAGAMGGYLGARLIEAGRDVSFLVRPAKAQKLRAGLFVRSPAGDIELSNPPVETADTLRGPFDLILLSCKAYDLSSAIEAMAPAAGPRTIILPLLNGMAHMNELNARFGKERVFGGWCAISATVDERGEIVHLQPFQSVSFGDQGGGVTDRVKEVAAHMSGAKFEVLPADSIIQEMWEKWIFIAAAAALTCLMRGAVGDVLRADPDLPLGLFEECSAIAKENGFAPRQPAADRFRATLTAPGSPFTASMLRDIEAGLPIEADHVLGDLLRRASDAESSPLLRLAYAHLKTYEFRRRAEKRLTA